MPWKCKWTGLLLYYRRISKLVVSSLSLSLALYIYIYIYIYLLSLCFVFYCTRTLYQNLYLSDSGQLVTLRKSQHNSTLPSCVFLTFSMYRSPVCAQPLNHVTIKDPVRETCRLIRNLVLLEETIMHLFTMITTLPKSRRKTTIRKL